MIVLDSGAGPGPALKSLFHDPAGPRPTLKSLFHHPAGPRPTLKPSFLIPGHLVRSGGLEGRLVALLPNLSDKGEKVSKLTAADVGGSFEQEGTRTGSF